LEAKAERSGFNAMYSTGMYRRRFAFVFSHLHVFFFPVLVFHCPCTPIAFQPLDSVRFALTLKMQFATVTEVLFS